MRIVHIDAGLEWRGGQKQVFLLHKGLLEANISSYLICHKKGELYQQTHSKLANSLGWNYSGKGSKTTSNELANLIDHIQPTIIHYHDSLSLNYSTIGTAFKLETRRVSYPINWFSRLSKYKRIHHHVGVSNTITTYLKKYFNSCSTIHSSIDLEYFSNPQNRQVLKNKGNYNILYVGAYSSQKGVSILINSFSELLKGRPNARLHLCGSGELQTSIDRQISKLKLEESVTQYGHQKQVSLFYNEADVVVVPSINGEGSSGTIKEGIASLKTVLASNIEPNKELITDGKDGYLFESGNSNSLTNLLLKQPEIKKETLETRRHDFSSQIMINEYIKLYQSFNL